MATFTREMIYISKADIEALTQEAEVLKLLLPERLQVKAFIKLVNWLKDIISTKVADKNYITVTTNGQTEELYTISANIINWLSSITTALQKGL